MKNYVLISPYASEDIYNYGGLQSLFKAYNFPDKFIRRTALEVLSHLKINKNIIYELSALGMVSESIKMLLSEDVSNQLHAAMLLKEITA
jgi:hypothetical protein